MLSINFYELMFNHFKVATILYSQIEIIECFRREFSQSSFDQSI